MGLGIGFAMRDELIRVNFFPFQSGHRLERDVETGGLTTRHHRKAMQIQKGAAERGLDDLSNSNILLTPTSSEVVTPTTPSGGKSSGFQRF